MWTERVEEPFRSDALFWSAVGRSVDALLTLVVATAVFAVFRGAAAVVFVVPVVLFAAALRVARTSSAAARARFDSREQWRDAERRAVALALPGAVVRRRFRHRNA